MKLSATIYQLLLSIFKVLPFKKQICMLLKALPLPREKFYKDVRFDGIYTTYVDGKPLRLRNNFDTTVENEIFWFGIGADGWERDSMMVWTKLAKSADVIFDIGANTGIYSLTAATLNKNAKIYAFEPSRNTFKKFEQIHALNGFENISLSPAAMSNQNGTATFYDYDMSHQYSASLNQAMQEQFSDAPKSNYEVKTITLDSFIEQNNIPKIDLLKLDVEMHEPEVFEGFTKYLKLYKPTMLVEILSDEIGEKIEKYFEGLDYVYFNIDESSAPQQVQSLRKSNYYNFLLCSQATARSLNIMR